MKIGILSLQGAVREHRTVLCSLGVEVVNILTSSDLSGIDGLILPGGESTTIGKLLDRLGLLSPIASLGSADLPIFGTCTGLILLSKHINRSDQFRIGLMDTWVERNGFGRQLSSFEADMSIPVLGIAPFHCIFIRAPYIDRVGEGVTSLLTINEKIVFAEQGNLLVSSFHPELTSDYRVHEYFLQKVQNNVIEQR
jgi:5'-phosphate synthase pdxT subunit